MKGTEQELESHYKQMARFPLLSVFIEPLLLQGDQEPARGRGTANRAVNMLTLAGVRGPRRKPAGSSVLPGSWSGELAEEVKSLSTEGSGVTAPLTSLCRPLPRSCLSCRPAPSGEGSPASPPCYVRGEGQATRKHCRSGMLFPSGDDVTEA